MRDRQFTSRLSQYYDEIISRIPPLYRRAGAGVAEDLTGFSKPVRSAATVGVQPLDV